MNFCLIIRNIDMNTRVPFTFNLMKRQKVHEHVVYIYVYIK